MVAHKVEDRPYKSLHEMPGGHEAWKDTVTSYWCAGVSHAPKLDYLTLGLSYDPALHEAMKWVVRHTFKLGRFVYRDRKMLWDGLQVGAINFSKGNSNRFGRKLLLDYTGGWFRAGFTEADAWHIRNEFEDWVFRYVEEVERNDWVTFTSIERVDWAFEVLKPSLEVTPQMVVDCKEVSLPGSFNWVEFSGSAEGLTHYAAGQRKGIANRRQKPLFRCYGYHPKGNPRTMEEAEHEARTLRFEAEWPCLRMADGTTNIEGASRETAKLFEALTPYRFISEYDLPEHWVYEGKLAPLDVFRVPKNTYIIPKLDFGGLVRPEEWARRPYAGHPSFEIVRQRAQGFTLLEKTIELEITAELATLLDINSSRFQELERIRTELELEYADEPECLELAWEKALEDLGVDDLAGLRASQELEHEHIRERMKDLETLRAKLEAECEGEPERLARAWSHALEDLTPEELRAWQRKQEFKDGLKEAAKVPAPGPKEDLTPDKYSKKQGELRSRAEFAERADSSSFQHDVFRLEKPKDHYELEDLRVHEPLPLEQIRHLQGLLHKYVEFRHPGEDPRYHESLHCALYYKWAVRPHEWIKRYLEPVPIAEQHDPAEWLKHEDEGGLVYYTNSEGKDFAPGDRSVIEAIRQYNYRNEAGTARRYRLRLQEMQENEAADLSYERLSYAAWVQSMEPKDD